MPIPLLFIAVAAATGALGIGKSVKAGVDTHTAKKVNESANDIIENAKNNLQKARSRSGNSLKQLGKTKATILSSTVSGFVSEFEKFKNIELKSSIGLDELSKFRIDKQSFDELKEMGGYATSILGGVAGGAMGGALTAFGAYSAAGALATASTGTAIASLSGAAATNATLAFFGGGSLAAGGLGIAGGTAVLGGLVAGPALAIMGFIVGAKASKSKDEAYSNLAIAKKNAAELNLASTICDGITERSKMFIKLLKELDNKLNPLVIRMGEIVSEYGCDYRVLPQEAKETLAAACSVAGCIKAVIDTPILTKDGSLTNESASILSEIKGKDPRCFVAPTKGKKMDLDQIIKTVTSNITTEYYEGTDYGYEVGNIGWEKLRTLINDTFGTKFSKTEMRASIDNYEADEPQEINHLYFDCERAICFYQVGVIVQSCSSADILHSLNINSADINWNKLLSKILSVYGVEMKDWQLKTQTNKDGTINVNKVLNMIVQKLTGMPDDKRKCTLYADELSSALR